MTAVLLLKIKHSDIYIPLLTGKPDLQQFTVRIGVLTSISSRQSAMQFAALLVAAHFLNKRTLDLQSAATQTHLCPSDYYLLQLT